MLYRNYLCIYYIMGKRRKLTYYSNKKNKISKIIESFEKNKSIQSNEVWNNHKSDLAFNVNKYSYICRLYEPIKAYKLSSALGKYIRRAHEPKWWCPYCKSLYVAQLSHPKYH